MRSKCLGAAVIGVAMLAAASAYAADAGPVLAEVATDLNGDGTPDRAVLTGAEMDVGLAVHLSTNGRLPADPTVHNPAIGWQGGMAGQKPELSVNARGSLVAVFQNDSVGRHRWRQQLTIAWRKGALVVAGYTYIARDTLDPNYSKNCDINFLSGKGTRNGKPVTVPANPAAVTSWSEKTIPKGCEP